MNIETKDGAVLTALHKSDGGWKYRWVFFYKDGRVKRGAWNGGDEDALKASKQPTNGLLAVRIEAIDHHQCLRPCADVPADEFCMIQWEAEGLISAYGKVVPRIIGITLVTTTQRVTFLQDGLADVQNRTPEDLHTLYQYGAIA